jgi:transcriptional pleiotropic regulator of transition state genes
MRRTLGIGEKDPLEMFTEKETIILRKYSPACLFCGSTERNIEYKGKRVCKSCIGAM